MKICYVDESGNNSSDPCLVMVGVLVDAYRLNRTREEFVDIFDDIQSLFQENLQELKGSKMIFGRDRWRKIDADLRKRITGNLCAWVSDRKHTLALAAICRDRLSENTTSKMATAYKSPWLMCGLHIALQVQKQNQSIGNNKGHTFLIFDDNKKEADDLSTLIWDLPAETDCYYGRGEKQSRLDQIVDTTFAIRSHYAGLVQVADLYAFIFRRYAELVEFGGKEEWNGERQLIEGYVSQLATRLLPRSVR